MLLQWGEDVMEGITLGDSICTEAKKFNTVHERLGQIAYSEDLENS